MSQSDSEEVIDTRTEEEKKRAREEYERFQIEKRQKKQRHQMSGIREPELTDDYRVNGMMIERRLSREWDNVQRNQQEFDWVAMIRTSYVTNVMSTHKARFDLASERDGVWSGTHVRELAIGWISNKGDQSMDVLYFYSPTLPDTMDEEGATNRGTLLNPSRSDYQNRYQICEK